MGQGYSGRRPRPEEQCRVCLGPLADQLVELHCGHRFCLRPCFERLIDFGHTLCPECRTPMVVMRPSPDYLRRRLYLLTKKPSTDENSAKYDRIFQYVLIHDGDTRPEVLKCNGGVPDDIFNTMRSACRCCPYAPRHLQVDAAAEAQTPS